MRQADMFLDTTTNMIIAEERIARLTRKAHRSSAVVYVASLAYFVWCYYFVFI